MRLWKNSTFAVLKNLTSLNSQMILKVLFTLLLRKLHKEKAARATKILHSEICFNKRTDYILSRRKKDLEEGGKAPGGRRGQNGTERKDVEPQCHSRRMKDTELKAHCIWSNPSVFLLSWFHLWLAKSKNSEHVQELLQEAALHCRCLSNYFLSAEMWMQGNGALCCVCFSTCPSVSFTFTSTTSDKHRGLI